MHSGSSKNIARARALAVLGIGVVFGTLSTGCSSAPSSVSLAASEAGISNADTTAASSPASPTVSVIGDSFSSGNLNSVVWPDVLADRFGWSMSNFSTGGAGYVAGTTFDAQADAVIERRPDFALVVGSENDAYEDPDEVGAAAADIFDRLARETPSTKVVVIGPIWSLDNIPVEMTMVDEAVQHAANDAGLSYFDALPLGWLSDPAYIQDDGDHPTDEGQVRLADDIADALREVEPQLLG